MICFSLKNLDLVELKIPVSVTAEGNFVLLGGPRDRKIPVSDDLIPEKTGNCHIERVDIEFPESPEKSFRLVKETAASRRQALVLLPPTGRYSYVSQAANDSEELSAASDDVALLVILQPGNKLLVRENGKEPGRKKVLSFDGSVVSLEPALKAV